MNWLTRFWHRIAQPRVQRIAYFILYLFHAVAGFAMMIGQAQFAGLDVLQTMLWGGFLALGGVFGAVSVLPGWNLFERVGIVGVVTGIAIYSVALALGPAENVPIRIALWCIVSAWLVVFAFRAWEIRRYLIAPSE